MSESHISISSTTTASSSFSEEESSEPSLKRGPGVDEPLNLVRMCRGVQADIIEAPCAPLVSYADEDAEAKGTCPICCRPFARWNEQGGYHCYMCRNMVSCNRLGCLQALRSLRKREGPCPLCRHEGGTFVWLAGHGLPFGGLTHDDHVDVVARIVARYEEEDEVLDLLYK